MDKIPKALVSALAIYALITLESTALMQVMAPDLYFGALTMVFAAAVIYAVSRHYYFSGMSVKEPLTDGVTFGVMVAAVMFILDIPVMVYGFAAEAGWMYFMQLQVMVWYALAIIVPAIVAYTMKK